MIEHPDLETAPTASIDRMEAFGPLASANVAAHLSRMAIEAPHQRAVVVSAGTDRQGHRRYVHYTFSQLERMSNRFAHGLARIGISRGTRTLLAVSPSLEYFTLVFALFKVGAVMVLIDPGLERKALFRCLREVGPEAFIGSPTAHFARLAYREGLKSVRILVTVGPRLAWGGHSLEALCDPAEHPPESLCLTREDEVAAILFTSGSTGVPKGAVYTHRIFNAQIHAIRQLYGISRGEIDVPTFPLFALFDPALGMTAVIPEMDPRHPAKADPAHLLELITDQGATQMFGSPALLDRFGRYGVAHGVKLPSMRRILSAGAPVRPDILRNVSAMLPKGAEVFTPYGATEALPVCNIGSEEVLSDTASRAALGWGICVGRPAPDIALRLIRITDEPLETFSEDLCVKEGEVGEITVRGTVVTARYDARPDQTALAKMLEGEAIVHRMGDLGWRDAEGRLWMCGRKSHRVETPTGPLFTEQVEGVFNAHPAVHRSALVGVGSRPHQKPVVLLELEPGFQGTMPGLEAELLELGRGVPLTQRIDTFLRYPGTFPVDVRHNAKIAREALAIWAATRVA